MVFDEVTKSSEAVAIMSGHEHSNSGGRENLESDKISRYGQKRKINMKYFNDSFKSFEFVTPPLKQVRTIVNF